MFARKVGSEKALTSATARSTIGYLSQIQRNVQLEIGSRWG